MATVTSIANYRANQAVRASAAALESLREGSVDWQGVTKLPGSAVYPRTHASELLRAGLMRDTGERYTLTIAGYNAI